MSNVLRKRAMGLRYDRAKIALGQAVLEKQRTARQLASLRGQSCEVLARLVRSSPSPRPAAARPEGGSGRGRAVDPEVALLAALRWQQVMTAQIRLIQEQTGRAERSQELAAEHRRQVLRSFARQAVLCRRIAKVD